MTWDEVLNIVADKHSISLNSCQTTKEKEDRIKNKLSVRRFQKYWIHWKYKQDKWFDIKSPI
jgi:hypothetical protein